MRTGPAEKIRGNAGCGTIRATFDHIELVLQIRLPQGSIGNLLPSMYGPPTCEQTAPSSEPATSVSKPYIRSPETFMSTTLIFNACNCHLDFRGSNVGFSVRHQPIEARPFAINSTKMDQHESSIPVAVKPLRLLREFR